MREVGAAVDEEKRMRKVQVQVQVPPTLLSLTIDAALVRISSFTDLSSLPDHILLDLFSRTLKAGKLNEKILKLFIATGQDEVLSFIQELNIQPIITPVLPTRCSGRKF